MGGGVQHPGGIPAGSLANRSTTMSSRHLITPSTYKLKRSIPNHAIERLRERLNTLEDQCRTDWELRNHLDEAVEEGIRSQACQFIIDTEGKNSLAVDIGTRFKGLVALIVPSLREGPPQCVVTVVTKTMADENLGRGDWRVVTGANSAEVKSFMALPTPPIRTNLGSAIRTVTPTPPATAQAPKPETASALPVTPVPTPPPPPATPTKMLMVRIDDPTGTKYEEIAETDAPDHIGKLLLEGKRARAYRELPLRMEVRFDAAA